MAPRPEYPRRRAGALTHAPIPMSWSPNAAQRSFVKQYGAALASGDVAAFCGAGVSRAAGYVDWKGLLKDIASDLQLDVDRETDLIAVAQYHLNERRNRGYLNQIIVDQLAAAAEPTRTHAILARLPLPVVWTTNYDECLERAFEGAGKIVDVKRTQENLAQTRRGRDVVVYKMHGCVTLPHETVITKDDYEQYASKRPLFVESLKGDLISRTFCFLGFSFTDPNIDYILSRVRVLLGTNVRPHFCIMRSPERPTPGGPETPDLAYDDRRLRLRQDDLRRFGIETVWVDDFAHVPELLEAVSSFVHRSSVFMAGAAADASPFGHERLTAFVRDLGARLIGQGYNLVSGFGLGLGEDYVIGALRAMYGIPQGSDLERLVVRPFPKATGQQQAANTRHREELIARSGVLVVVAGNRTARQGGTELSPGVQEEVEIALREKKPVVPVGATGHTARVIWERAMARPADYLPGVDATPELTALGNADLANDELLDALFVLLGKIARTRAV